MWGKVIVFRIKIVDEHFLLAASPCSFLSRPVSQLSSPPYQPPYVTSPTDQLYRRKIKSVIDLLPCYKLGERHSAFSCCCEVKKPHRNIWLTTACMKLR